MPAKPQSKTSGSSNRLPLVVFPENRDESTAKDSKLINAFGEKVLNETSRVVKRPGTVRYLQVTSAGGQGNGCYNWQGTVYSVVGGTFYAGATSIGGVNSSGPYKFNSILGATPTLFFHNRQAAYGYNSTSGLFVVNPSQLASMVPGQAYLDATTYVMNPSAGIYGSGLNGIASSDWDPLNLIVAQIEPDGGVALAKQLVYVIAFKNWSTEVFYDAGNPNGSPLGAVQGGKVDFGCRSGDLVADIDGVLLWVTQTRNGSLDIMQMESLKATVISIPPVVKLLEKADFSIGWALGVTLLGHRFYIITLKNSSITLVYDLSSGLWAQWQDPNGNYFPFVASTYLADGSVILQHETDGYLYKLDPSSATDNGINFTMQIVTPLFDGGVRLKKTLYRLDFIADQISDSLIVNNSDDDYQTWTNPRTVDLSVESPHLSTCGTFRKRAYKILYTGAYPLRLSDLEPHLDVGSL